MKRNHFPAVAALLLAPAAWAQDNTELAKKLSNPVASLISVPFQLNWDDSLGPFDDGDRWLLNVQPVIPVSLNDDWNLISRTILPLVDVDFGSGQPDASGLGDVVQSFFFSPVAPTDSGWILGAGPVFLLPTATDELLGAEKWGAGPTAVALRQQGPWTYGALVNHIWSFAGKDSRNDVDATFLQPFVSYVTPSAVTYTFNSESTYDWESEQWTVPVNAFVSKVTRVGDQLVSVGGGARYYLDAPEGGPDWGLRFVVTLLFPK